MSYLDTSALLSLFLPDAHTDLMRRWLDEEPPEIATSAFALAELGAVLGNRVRNREMTALEAKRLLDALDHWIAAEAVLLPIEDADHLPAANFVRAFTLALRAPDALHVALCRRVGAALLTFDARQAEAARRLGVECDPAGV